MRELVPFGQARRFPVSSAAGLLGDDFVDLSKQGRASTLLVVAPLVEVGTLTDLGNRRALLRLKGEEAHDQVFEVLR